MSNTRERKTPPQKATTSKPTSSERLKAAAPVALPLPAARSAKLDPEAEARIHVLVSLIAKEDGREMPPEWVFIAHQAKQRGYLREQALRLYITNHGKQWLRAEDESGHTMVKCTPAAKLALKDLARVTNTPMQDAIGELVHAMYEHNEALTRFARRHGGEHPWDAIPALLKLCKNT